MRKYFIECIHVTYDDEDVIDRMERLESERDEAQRLAEEFADIVAEVKAARCGPKRRAPLPWEGEKK